MERLKLAPFQCINAREAEAIEGNGRLLVHRSILMTSRIEDSLSHCDN